MRNFALLVGVLGLAVGAVAADKKKPIKALMIAGGCCHDYPKQKNIVSKGISARANVTWTIVEESKSRAHKISVYKDDSWADGFDVVVHNECFGGVKDAEFVERIKRYKCVSATFRMNVALSELPDFRCVPGTSLQPHHQSGIVIGPSMEYLERAYDDARRFGWSREPVVEMLIPSTVDATLAPDGKHVASLFCQHFDPVLPEGRTWDDARIEAADCIIDTVTRHAPNFRSSILATMILSPTDLERKFGLVGGDIFHGELSLSQLYSARPLLGHGDYRGPLGGLYMCGSGTHPGGGVTGIPGHNAAREILRDRRRPWLRPKPARTANRG